MSEHVRLERRGAVLRIEMNRPEKRNALTVEMYQALASGVRGAADDPEVRVIFLAGAGEMFTAGNDLRDFLERPPTGDGSQVNTFLQALIDNPLPVVAAVQGMAVGIGTTMLLHCDLVYAGRGARFHLPFVSLGLVPEAGSSRLLPQRVGYARAAEMLLLGEPATAEEAWAMGLVSRIFADEDLAEEAWSRAERLAEQPPEALRATKELMRTADREILPDHMRRESRHFVERLRSDEARAVMQRFFERKKG